MARKNNLKAWFGFGYFLVCAAAIIAAAIGILSGTARLAWTGVALAAAPFVFLWIRAHQGGKGAPGGLLSAALPTLAVAGVLLSVLAVTRESAPAAIAFFSALVAGGFVLFDLWYSRLHRAPSELVRPGEPLPEFETLDLAGNAVSRADLTGAPALLMFFRGNWCPFCNAQVQQLAARYRELNARGVRLVFVSPQPADLTRRVAESLGVEIDFWVDRDCSAARALGLVHTDGVPVGLRGKYGRDTVLPTVILLDAEGSVIHCDETDDYRKRPRPEVFLDVFRKHGI